MKTPLIILIIGVALALNIGIKRDGGANKRQTKSVQSSTRTLRVGLAGITPSNSAQLADLLRKTPGVKDFQIDIPKKKARINIDLQKTNVPELFESMRNLGITAWL